MLDLSKFGNLEIWSLGAENLEMWKSRALGVDFWKFGNLEIWKPRALGLDLWNFENIESSWKFGNGGFATEQLWILGGGG